MGAMNVTKLSRSGLNVSVLNASEMNGASYAATGSGEGTVVIPNCLLLEDGGALLWEDGTPALMENLPALKRRIKTK